MSTPEFPHFMVNALWHGRCLFGHDNKKEILILAIVHRSPEQRSSVPGHAATQTAQLLAELSPNSDLAWLVERVARTNLPWVVIPGTAITAWEGRDPAGWEKVSDWLAARGVAIVRI